MHAKQPLVERDAFAVSLLGEFSCSDNQLEHYTPFPAKLPSPSSLPRSCRTPFILSLYFDL